MATITVLDSTGTTQTVAKVSTTGTTTATNSLPVVIATDDTVLGALNETAPASDTGASGLNGRMQRLAQRISSLINLTPALGAAADSTSTPVSLSTESKALLGATNETAAATDTSNGGHNSLLKRIAQNLTTLNTSVNTANTQLPTVLGETTRAASLSVVDATAAFSAKVGLTRTADTNVYLANDVIGAATGSTAALTFGSMGPSAGRVLITTAELEIDAAAIISGETSYRLYLYNVTPPSALGDNAPWDLPSGDRASFLGYVDLGTVVDLGSTLYVQSTYVGKQVLLAGTSLFAYLVTIGPYTPTSARVHSITLHAVSL